MTRTVPSPSTVPEHCCPGKRYPGLLPSSNAWHTHPNYLPDSLVPQPAARQTKRDGKFASREEEEGKKKFFAPLCHGFMVTLLSPSSRFSDYARAVLISEHAYIFIF